VRGTRRAPGHRRRHRARRRIGARGWLADPLAGRSRDGLAHRRGSYGAVRDQLASAGARFIELNRHVRAAVRARHLPEVWAEAMGRHWWAAVGGDNFPAMTRWLTVPFSLIATAALADAPKQAQPGPEPKAGGYSGLGAESLSPQEVARYAPT